MTIIAATARTVAKEILSQMGGAGRLGAMINAKNFAATEKTLSFCFMKSRVNKANYIKITLNGLDLYDIQFIKLTKYDAVLVSELNNIYANQLKQVFIENTGLELSL